MALNHRPSAGSLDLTDDFFSLELYGLAEPDGSKRENNLNGFIFDLDFDNDEANEKRIKLENDVNDLMAADLEDDDFAPALGQECGILDSDFDVNNLLFDDEVDIATTPLTAHSRNKSICTPPLSPSAEEELRPFRGRPSQKGPWSPKPEQSICEDPSLSVLCDEILDLDTITDQICDSALLPMPSDLTNCCPPDFTAKKDKKITMVRRVSVEERTLSTEQKVKHALWIRKRKRCLTGHKGYKCPAKSLAAKKKVRANGRFDLSTLKRT